MKTVEIFESLKMDAAQHSRLVRVSDIKAEELVNSNTIVAKYVPKSRWKKQQRRS